jgi:cell division protein FtsA
VRIIEPRIREILRLTAREISKAGYEELLAAGVVLTGGTSLLGGITNLAEELFQMPARDGFPVAIPLAGECRLDPSHATAAGLIHLAGQRTKREITAGASAKWFTKIRRWFK